MKRGTAIAALLVASACEAGGEPGGLTRGESQPIIGGFATTTDPAVVFTASSGGNCTGTLISPKVVLTAAHCIIDSIEAGQTSSGSVGFGDEVGSFSQTIGITDMYAHRYYDAAVVRRYDIGLVRLSEPPEGIEPVPFNQEPLGEDLLGAQVRILGFGVTDGENQTGAGTKRQVDVTIDEITSEHIGLGDETRNICQGDSGGPTLLEIDGEERVVAVSSFGSNACMNRSYVTRTDIYAEALREVRAAWDGPCEQNGECVTEGCGDFSDPDCEICAYDGFCAADCERLDLDCPVAGFAGDSCQGSDDCESRLCGEAPEDPRVGFCTVTCDPGEEEPCPAPLSRCEEVDGGHQCFYPGTTPRVQGASCETADDCRSGICDSKNEICIEPCGDGMADCQDPYSCENVGDGIRACTFATGGSCAIAGSGRSAAGASLLILFGLLLVMRRRP